MFRGVRIVNQAAVPGPDSDRMQTNSHATAMPADPLAEPHPGTSMPLHAVEPVHAGECVDSRTVRGVLRTAALNRIERFGERELRQRSAQEIAFILLAFAVAALIAVPALIPLVVAVRGGQL